MMRSICVMACEVVEEEEEVGQRSVMCRISNEIFAGKILGLATQNYLAKFKFKKSCLKFSSERFLLLKNFKLSFPIYKKPNPILLNNTFR